MRVSIILSLLKAEQGHWYGHEQQPEVDEEEHEVEQVALVLVCG
jgi:hypothetical protein